MDEQPRYLGYPIAAAHPWQLAWTAWVFGGPRPNLDRARILEIGCGDGAHLLSIAAFEPQWTLLGLDLAPEQLECARECARQCGLANVAFEQVDLANATVEAGAWDFVLAHGIYSWIDPARRAALRQLIRRALAPNGLAVLSFNAQPGWGVRGRVRDILMQHPEFPPRDLLARLRAQAPTEEPWGQLLANELDFAGRARADYLQHEFLAEHNAAFWVSEVVRDAAQDGLALVGDSQFDLPDGRPTEMARRQLGIEGLAAEEMADLLTYRQFRSLVLARDDAERAPAAKDAELLSHAYVSGVVIPDTPDDTPDEQPAWDWSGASQVSYRSEDGTEILVREPLCKMALDELARIHPDAVTASELAERARARLGELNVPTEPREEETLREGILSLWRVGALDLRVHRPRIRRDQSSPLGVAPLVRYEAALRHAVSTPLGVMLNLSDEDQAALCALGPDSEPPPALAELLSRWGLWA